LPNPELYLTLIRQTCSTFLPRLSLKLSSGKLLKAQIDELVVKLRADNLNNANWSMLRALTLTRYISMVITTVLTSYVTSIAVCAAKRTDVLTASSTTEQDPGEKRDSALQATVRTLHDYVLMLAETLPSLVYDVVVETFVDAECPMVPASATDKLEIVDGSFVEKSIRGLVAPFVVAPPPSAFANPLISDLLALGTDFLPKLLASVDISIESNVMPRVVSSFNRKKVEVDEKCLEEIVYWVHGNV
jgi:hypothetical protein